MERNKEMKNIIFYSKNIFLSSYYVCKAIGSVWRHDKILDPQGIRYFH